MKTITQLCFLAVCLALVSCAEVVSKNIVGDTPAKLDPKKWNGAWSTEEGESIHARVKDAGKGLLEVAWLEVSDNAIEMKKLDVHIREAGGWLWASYKEEGKQDYVIARIGEPDKNLLAWSLKFEPLAALVKSGKLKGEVLKDDKGNDTKTLRIDGLHDIELEQIREGKWGEVFKWDKPDLNVRFHRD